MLPERFELGIAEHLVGAMVPADQVTVKVDFEQGVGRRQAQHGPAGAAQLFELALQLRQRGGQLRAVLLLRFMAQAQTLRDARLKHRASAWRAWRKNITGALLRHS